MIDRSWLTTSERLILDEALIRYSQSLATVRKRATAEDAKDDAKWRLHVVNQLRDQLAGR